MEHFTRLENKLDKLDERLDVVDKHLAVYNLELKEHIRRTEILEAELKPIKSHVQSVQSVFKFLIGLLGLSGAITALLKYFGK